MKTIIITYRTISYLLAVENKEEVQLKLLGNIEYYGYVCHAKLNWKKISSRRSVAIL